ncbi:MAG TPA: restriction endonuclease [Saprospiraceae bacterium]|nr:restriction endonuclease [Saprospiraceae bacterium]
MAEGLLFFSGVVICVFSVITNSDKRYGEKIAKATEIINKHMTTLAVRRQQLVKVDHYGVVDDEKWQKEISHFVCNVILPEMGGLLLKGSKLDIEISKLVDDLAASKSTTPGFSTNMTPIEYEHYVCHVLNDSGWSARVTKASGDQGVDVIAHLGSKSVVIQCKLYNSQAVGNAAVQEAIAGREFEKTRYAAVVSNATYTPAAKQLAASASVFLLHHDELPGLEERLASN